MRDALTVIVVLMIIAVLLDGWRRMRRSRQQSIKMSLSMHKGVDKEDLDEYGSELPSGGARVVGTRDDEDVRAVTKNLQQNFVDSRVTTGGRSRIPEQVALNLDEEVPTLMDSVAESGRVEPSLGELPADDDLLHDPVDDAVTHDEERDPLFEPLPKARVIPRHTQSTASTPKQPSADTMSEGILSEPRTIPKPGPTQQHSLLEPDPQPEIAADEPVTRKSESGAKESQPVTEKPQLEQEPEEVLVINVTAAAGDKFQGADLLQILFDCGLRYGDMQIFHRYEHADGSGELLFSLVNMVVPGTFNLDEMEHFATPGVSLFMTLPLNANSRDAFETMAATAKALADQLGGELKDENRSVMTEQTLEHCRQRIQDFERKRLVS